MRRDRTRRLQSAMEYLMTYGWAILIIAVVLGALFQLGVFNAGTFSPKAPPGACQVFRPNGPGSVSNINLEGVCNGELPQYVASFGGTADIITSSFSIPNTGTMTAWVYDTSTNAPNNPGVVGYNNDYPEIIICSNNPQNIGYVLDLAGTRTFGCTSTLMQFNKWIFITLNYSASGASETLNGAQIWSTSTSATSGITAPLTFGLIGSGYWFGYLANIQIYNASLSANEIEALYTEGIGGAPIKPQNLVAWWPLNGNANDYSGNNNNGVPSGVTYTNQWTGGYTTP
ncbi:MAG: LamG domain-containing protein [Candidatus Marsarchaeota archaeon]|nr:LamG domain-containing protein [Candidatus Marsarchaeota archaeon]